jgi:hypothetical protein
MEILFGNNARTGKHFDRRIVSAYPPLLRKLIVFQGLGVLLAARTASWHLPAAVNTLSKAVSVRSFASSGSESRFEYAQ